MAPPRGPRKPACDPCRLSKLACDHGKPACGRCRAGNKTSACVYRTRPFSRRGLRPPSQISDPGTEPTVSVVAPSPIPSLTRGCYPNPGYLGASSHVAIFNHLSSKEDPLRVSSLTAEATSLPAFDSSLEFEGEIQAAKVSKCIKTLLQEFPLKGLIDLISFWRATGPNLSLAEPFVDLCYSAWDDSRAALPQDLADARSLIQNSTHSLADGPSFTLEQYASQFLGPSTRLETVGLLFCAVIRAASEVNIFPSLYLTSDRRQTLLGLALNITNVAVEICLSMDRLNDLQLVLQYENFISHSFVFGVQSYHSYRKLGDVITSIVALGYHERVGTTTEVPTFLINIRRTAFARTYSADKNWGIFLGRPPRLGKKFCQLQHALSLSTKPDEEPLVDPITGTHTWPLDSGISIWAETRWTALCASLKEEILELFNDDSRDDIQRKVDDLKQRASDQWQALPENFRMEGSLKDYNIGPFPRDFLLSTRLNYLHVLFLLRLLCLGSAGDPDADFVNLSQEILSLVVEGIVLRNHLVCSTGTSFEWKLAHYGLPAIGIMMIAMLRPGGMPEGLQEAKVIRDLGIVVTEVDMGTIVQPSEPNYALLSRATNTIKKFLDCIFARDRHYVPLPGTEPPDHPVDLSSWIPQSQLEPWDFEVNFWDNLAEHPSMFNFPFPTED